MSLLRINEHIIDTTGNYTFNELDLTANLTAGNANLGNAVTANFFIGNGSLLSGIVATTAQTVTTAAQPNITSTCTLASLAVSGLITATSGGIKVGNLQDTSGTNTVQLTNSNMLVTGNISAGAGGTGNVTATYFIGNGSQLTGISGGSSYSNSNVAAYLPTYTGNIGADFITATGNVTAINANLGNLVTANYITGTLTTAAQPNITSVGSLSSLTVSGIISPNNSAELRSAPAISSGTLTIDLNSAAVFDVSLTENITTLTLANTQSAGRTSSFVLILTADGTARTVVWPASFNWPSATAPTITSTSGKKDVFVFFTVDGGTFWQSFISGQNL